MTTVGKEITMSQLKVILKRSKELYPQSKSMRRQWVRKTVTLYESGRHALITGGWSNGQNRAH